MRATKRMIVISAALFIAVPACGSASSGSSDALVGQWAGKCTATKDQDGSRAADDADAKLRFDQDGKYSQASPGPDGGQVDGSYTVAAQTINLKANGDSIAANYTIKDGVLTTTTQDKSGETPVTSTCTMRRSSGG